MENLTLSHPLILRNGNVLDDTVSGHKLVLNKTALRFYEIYCSLGSGEHAIGTISREFDIDRELAKKHYNLFLKDINQGQYCAGSILPGRHHAVLEPTAACNGGCPHCYHTSHREKWPEDHFQDIIHSVQNAGIRSVSITGGEVFSPHFVESFFKLVADLKSRDIVISSVSTNATFLTETIRDRILEAISPRTVFRISLDALRGDLLDRVRPGYRKLKDPYSPIRDLDTSGYQLVFTTNISTQTVNSICEIGEYLRQYQNIQAWNLRLAVPVHVKSGSLRPQTKSGRMLETCPSPDKPLPYFYKILKEHANNPYPFNVRMGNYLMTSLLENPQALAALTDDHPCREDKYLLTVKASGEVTQCPILNEIEPQFSMGSVLEGDSAGVLNEDFEKSLPLSNLSIQNMECKKCSLRPVCGGGCRLYALAYDQGVFGCDLPAKALLQWIKDDPTGVLRLHWPDYHERFTLLVS